MLSVNPPQGQAVPIAMPSGKPSTNTSAEEGRGNYCPEMDLLEATTNSTAHFKFTSVDPLEVTVQSPFPTVQFGGGGCRPSAT